MFEIRDSDWLCAKVASITTRNLHYCFFGLTNNDITNFFGAGSAFGELGGTPDQEFWGPFFCLTSFLIERLNRERFHLIDLVVRLIFSFYSQTSFPSPRRCSGCTKKRSLLTNSFFEEFRRVALGTLLLSIYYFIADDSQRITTRRLHVNHGLISNIFRRLQDVCSRDLADRPIIPFGSLGSVVKCDESKFNHKPKVNFFLFLVHFWSQSLISHKEGKKTLNL